MSVFLDCVLVFIDRKPLHVGLEQVTFLDEAEGGLMPGEFLKVKVKLDHELAKKLGASISGPPRIGLGTTVCAARGSILVFVDKKPLHVGLEQVTFVDLPNP